MGGVDAVVGSVCGVDADTRRLCSTTVRTYMYLTDHIATGASIKSFGFGTIALHTCVNWHYPGDAGLG